MVETPSDWIKVANVQRIKRTNGRIDLYFRMGDYREGPLTSPDGTQALADEVAAIKARVLRVAEAHKRPKSGTIAGILKDYNRSAEFLALARSTQYQYQEIIDELTEDFGDVLLKDLSRSQIMDMRNLWALRGHRASANRVQVLKNACAPIIEDEQDQRITGDPFHKVKKAPKPHTTEEAHPIWEDHEFEAALARALKDKLPGLARALALARYAGYRRGTICDIPRHARVMRPNERGDMVRSLYWVTEKRGVLSDKREDERLTNILESTPNKALTLAYNADGHPFKERQLAQSIERLMHRLVKDGLVRGSIDNDGKVHCPLTLHGLRHSRGVELAQGGASDAEIMAQLDHRTEAAARIYRKQARRRHLADSAQDKVDNVVNLRAKKLAANKAGT